MATRRGPKLEPHENIHVPEETKVEVEVKELPVIEEIEVTTEPVDTTVTQEEFVEQLEKFHDVDAEAEINKVIEEEKPVEVHFEFQKEYFLGGDDKPAVIDELPRQTGLKRKKSISELSQSEYRMYQKTGIIPEI